MRDKADRWRHELKAEKLLHHSWVPPASKKQGFGLRTSACESACTMQGRTGEKGAKGSKGARGNPGQVGYVGRPGLDGLDGAKGGKGAPGFPGIPGRKVGAAILLGMRCLP